MPDIVVVGGGIIGAACAFELAESWRVGHAAREGRARGRRLRAEPRVPRHLEGSRSSRRSPAGAWSATPRSRDRSADAVLPRRRADRDARRHDRRGRARRPPRLGRVGRGGGRRGRAGRRAGPRDRTRALARGARGLPAARGSPRGPARPHGVPRRARPERRERRSVTTRPLGGSSNAANASPGVVTDDGVLERRRGRARRRAVVAGDRASARRLAPDRLGARLARPRGARTPAVPPLDPERGAPPARRPGDRRLASEPGALRLSMREFGEAEETRDVSPMIQPAPDGSVLTGTSREPSFAADPFDLDVPRIVAAQASRLVPALAEAPGPVDVVRRSPRLARRATDARVGARGAVRRDRDTVRRA